MTSVRDGHMSFASGPIVQGKLSSFRKGTLMTTRRGNGNGEGTRTIDGLPCQDWDSVVCSTSLSVTFTNTYSTTLQHLLVHKFLARD